MRLICPVASEVWLKHFLTVLGVEAEIKELPKDVNEDLRSEAAREILKIYTD